MVSADLIRIITDALPVLIAYFDEQIRYRFVNRAYEDWFGLERGQMIGRTLEEVMGVEGFALVRPRIEAALAGQVVTYQAVIPHAGGEGRPIEATYVPHVEGGRVLGFIALVSNISERLALEQQRSASLEAERRARAEAEAERNNLHRLFAQAPAAIAILRGPELRYDLSNPLNQELAGGRVLVGRTVREAMPELEADGLFALANQVYRSGEPLVVHELPVTLAPTPERAERRAYLSGTYQPLRGADGSIEGLMAFAYEVTDQVQARRRAEQAETRLRLALDAAGLGTFDYFVQEHRLACDDGFRALFGLSPGVPITPELISSAIHPDDLARTLEAVARALDPAGDGLYALQYRTIGIEDGCERWVEARGRSFFDDQGRSTHFIGTGVDITQSKRAGERMQFLADASAVLGSSLDGWATLSHIAALAVPRVADWCSVDMLDEQGGLQPLALAHGDAARVELVREVRRRYPPDVTGETGLARVLRTGVAELMSVIEDEHLVRGAQDEQHLEILRNLGLRSAMVVPLVIRDRAIGVVTFVSAESRRRYGSEDLAVAEELARRASIAVENAQLFQAATVAIEKRDEFLSIASHELKTPLASLKLYLDGCRREITRAELGAAAAGLEKRLDRTSHQIDRITRLVNDLLDVSRISAGRMELALEAFDLTALAADVIGRFDALSEATGSPLRLRIDGEVAGSWDRQRLDEVLTNLISNALKFGAGKPVEVSVEATSSGARLRVSDEGPGVRPEDRQRIFERFERTDQARHIGGMGLGLWIVDQIVRAHGGQIAVDEARTGGARFIVDLPSPLADQDHASVAR